MTAKVSARDRTSSPRWAIRRKWAMMACAAASFCAISHAVPKAAAQATQLADTLVFQQLVIAGIGSLPVESLAFDSDTIHVDHTTSIIQRVVESGDWTIGWVPSFLPFGRTSKGDLRFDPDGVIYQGREGFKYDRSDDRGQTWVRADYPATVFPFHTPGGDLLGTWNEIGYGVARSEDGGQTWAAVPFLPAVDPTIPYVYQAIPPGGGRVDPRIVACGKSALAYSDDDGHTWIASNVAGPNAILCRSMVTVAGGVHDGWLLAAVDDFRGPEPKAGIFRTQDGETWERVSQVFEDATTVYLSPGSNGVVLAWDRSHDRVSGSDDGGATWRVLTASMSGILNETYLVRLNDLEVGPDGHVYAATTRSFGEGEGLYRSVSQVYTVASGGQPAPAFVSLTVLPNPAGRHVTVELASEQPRRVRLTVADIRGRTVAEVYEGAVTAGGRSFALNTSGWAAGVYIVRAEVAGRIASAQLVVGR